MDCYQKLQNCVKQNVYDIRRLGREGRLAVLFNYGMDTSDIQLHLKLDDVTIEQMANNVALTCTDKLYIEQLINTFQKTKQAAMQGASRETVDAIRADSMPNYKNYLSDI